MTGRVPAIDGLRAISILLVLAAHAAVTEHFPASLRHADWLIGWGSTGVHVFFVISGFLITSLLLSEEAQRGRVSLRAFYLRRCLRILPVYVGYLVAAVLFDRVVAPASAPAELWRALTFTTGLFPQGSWLFGHTWSLAVEEHFYLLWPLAFVVVDAHRARWLVAVTVVAVAPLVRGLLAVSRARWLIEFSFAGQGDAIMWGCLLALALARRRARRGLDAFTGRGRIAAAALAVVGVALLRWHGYLPGLVVPFGPTVEAVAVSAIIAALVMGRGGVVGRALAWPPLVGIGILSYSLYLWQEIILFPRNPRELWWQCFPQNLAVVAVVAVVSYVVIERPFLQLGRRLANRSPSPSFGRSTHFRVLPGVALGPDCDHDRN